MCVLHVVLLFGVTLKYYAFYFAAIHNLLYFTLLQLYECRKSQNHIYVMLLNPFAFSVYLSIDLCFCSSYSSFLRRYVFPKSVSYGKMWASKLKKDVARRIRRLETVRLKWLQSVDISKVIAGMWFPYCLVSHQLCELLPTFASSLLIPNATFCVLFLTATWVRSKWNSWHQYWCLWTTARAVNESVVNT